MHITPVTVHQLGLALGVLAEFRNERNAAEVLERIAPDEFQPAIADVAWLLDLMRRIDNKRAAEAEQANADR